MLRTTLTLLALSLASSFANANDIQTGNQKVKDFLESTELVRVKTYCTPGKDDCRTLYQRRNKETGELSLSFYDKFSSTARGVESVCYIIHNEQTGKYEIYSDLTPDGVVKIDQFLPQNGEVTVTYDKSYPTVSNLVLSKLGTTSGVKGTMKFSSTYSSVQGNLIELSEPNDLKDSISVEYNVIATEIPTN